MNRCNSNNSHPVRTLSGTSLKQVEDYKYLGSYISSAEKDFTTRNGMACSACNDMHKMWSSQLPNYIKVKIFRATIEPILLYGSETWMLSRKVEKRLDGTYTRLLRRAQSLSWKSHPTISQIYGKLPRVSSLVKYRRVQFAGHCFRADDEVISSLLLWRPPYGQTKGRKLSFPDVLKYQQAGSLQLVPSSTTKNATQSTVRGVGIPLSQKASENLLKIESISPSIMVLELEGNPKTTVICVYSQHNSSSESGIEDFYTKLRSAVEQVPHHNFLVISGDLNAKLGPDNARFKHNKETNRNGEHLIDFMEEFSLFASNTSSMKPKGQLWTFEYPKGGRAQLDYLIFRKKWSNSVKDSRAYSTFSSVSSDHRVISATLNLSLRVSKKNVSYFDESTESLRRAIPLSHKFTTNFSVSPLL